MSEIKLTPQEDKFYKHILAHNEIVIDDLRKLCVNTSSKDITVKKVISDIKRKYNTSGLQDPFAKCKISTPIATDVKKPNPVVATQAPVQIQVEMRKTIGGNLVPATNKELDARIDFVLEPMLRRVRTKKYGSVNLSVNEWELFEFFHKNAEKPISLEDMKAVVYKNFGSKTPHNWSTSIKGTIGLLRVNLPDLKKENRLLTIISNNQTFYMLK